MPNRATEETAETREVTVRPLRTNEIETLVDDLWLPFAKEMAELDPYNRLADDVRADAVDYRQTTLEDDSFATFVADTDGTIVGYTVVSYKESPPVFARGPEANVEEVYVKPAWRGAGIADRLMDRAESWGDDRGCDIITLSVNEANETARELYDSRGYFIRRHRMHKPID